MNTSLPFQILINSSKTMAAQSRESIPIREPLFVDEARILAAHLKTLSQKDLMQQMHISLKLSQATHDLIAKWGASGQPLGTALDTFSGDIYRGLKAETFTHEDRQYADQMLGILSGLYGFVQPFDAIQPYRLEMMYRVRPEGFKNLYEFWGSRIADALSPDVPIVNLASEEYFKMIAPYVDSNQVIAPQFMTRQAGSDAPTFVAIHAKWARGSFARWLIVNRCQNAIDFNEFDELGYVYDEASSTPLRPTFIRPM